MSTVKNEMNLVGLGIKIGVGVALLIAVAVLIGNMVTTVNADEIVVKQDVIGGQLHVWDTPGVHFQNFGTITRYKRSAQLWFSAKTDEGKETDDSIKVRFNDGGHGNISGSLRYTLPTDQNKMVSLHQTYHSMEAIDHELVRQVVNKSVFMSGPLMSSRESYAEKRADLINYITDQIIYGVYRTEHDQIKTTDPLTGQEKILDVVKPRVGAGPNGIEREEDSPIQKFGMNASNITINGIDYDPAVEAQIKQQQEAIMAVQQAIVNSKKAEQDTLTVEQQGKAEAAKAKWAQEVEKATAVTAAEKDKEVAVTQATKDKEVAQLSLETARLAAQQTVAEAKADADAKKLQVQANNNLQDRLQAYVTVNQAWAAAYGNQRQTPDILFTPSGNGGSNVSTMMEVLGAKAARDLNVDPKP
jgi:regulator of protease activity HflC (stomatin/prohibitin superfamily)